MLRYGVVMGEAKPLRLLNKVIYIFLLSITHIINKKCSCNFFILNRYKYNIVPTPKKLQKPTTVVKIYISILCRICF